MHQPVRPSSLIAVCGVVALLAGGIAGAAGGAFVLFVERIELAAPAGDDAASGSDAGVPFTDAAPGRDVAVALGPGDPEHHVRLRMPDDAIALRLRATSDGPPVWLRVRFGADGDAPWDDDASWDHATPDTAQAASLDVSGASAELAGAWAEVCVESETDPDAAATVTVHADVVRSSVDATLTFPSAAGDAPPTATWRGATTPESGFRRTIAIDVPASATALRLDVADASSDLDLYVHEAAPLVNIDDADAEAAGYGTDEWIVLDAESEPALVPGRRVFVTVADPSDLPYPVSFRLVASLAEEPPADLARPPALPQPTDPRERALLCVVEVLTQDGSGSGTIVSEDGLVVTAYHVVEAQARAVAEGRPGDADRIVLAVTLDAREVARDLFSAEVVHSDHELDLAMLRITGTARGAGLPPGYRFPAAKLSRRSPRFLGETLYTVGYPAAGGVGTRVTQTLSRGVVSGYGRAAKGFEIKTDAFVSPGSSGGAAFDDRWELAGVPVSTTDGGTTGTVLGHVVPVDAIPQEWWR